VRFGEVWHQLRRLGKDIERFLKVVLLAKDRSENELRPRIAGIVVQERSDFFFGGGILLVAHESSNLRGRAGAGTDRVAG